MSRSNRSEKRALTLTHPDASGIDIGSESHFVAVPLDRAAQPVREFRSFSADLKCLADWLEECQIKTVAMESTGVYWIPLYDLLASRGFEVLLVDARSVKNVPGRKSDVLDCQWLQQLLSYGLVRGAFRPSDEICELRTLARQRAMLVKGQARQVQHIQKALVHMNLQLANVISDVMGVTGQKILRAILAGERDGKVLAGLKHQRIKASEEEIARSLEGTWRPEHLFALKQAVEGYDFLDRQIAACDHEIEKKLATLHQSSEKPPKPRRANTASSPGFDARDHLYKVCGVDLTQIDGISDTTALTFLSEVGRDLSQFKTAKHFASWLGLCPGTRITGGKRISGKTRRAPNRLAQALKLAASALRRSKSALGAYFRRLCARMGKAEAITATAHKLARLIYALITKGQEYHDQGQDYFEEKYRERVVKNLRQRAEKLGLKLVSPEKDPKPPQLVNAHANSVS
jgi:transposase